MSVTDYQPFVIANSASDLKGLMEENSYLFFCGVLPQEDVLKARREALELCAAQGWVHPDYDLMEGVFSGVEPPAGEGDPRYRAMYRVWIHSPRFLELPHHPVILDVVGQLLGGEVLVHPRKIGRVTFPQNLITTTPPHQDFFYIRGAPETYTVWLPLGDCPQRLGGLAVLKGSHRLGFLPHVKMRGTGGNGVEIDEATAEWHTDDFRCGDLLAFHSHSVHKALHNLDERHLRLSVDNRYQRQSEEVHPSSLRTHFDL